MSRSVCAAEMNQLWRGAKYTPLREHAPAEHLRAIEMTGVGLERHVRERRRPGVRHLEPGASRLREQTSAQLFANRAHPLDSAARLQLLEIRQARGHRHGAGEIRSREEHFLRRLLQAVAPEACGQRIAVCNRLAVGREVGAHAEQLA